MTIGIQRIQEAVYQIGDKTQSLRINADNDQVLEVRVGSSWIKLDDYLKTLKNREEVQIQAELEETKDAQPTGAAPAKKKKKKKAKKKADLDLDMDEDDPTQQTRFAGLVKTEEGDKPEQTKRASEAKLSKAEEKALRKKAGGLEAIGESDEEDSDGNENGEDD